MPMARRVPISRVRSRMAMARVFTIPTATMTMSTVTSTFPSQVTAVTIQERKLISSSQVVTSSFCPVQSSAFTLNMSFCQ